MLGVPPTLANFASGLEHSIYNNVRQGQEHFYEQTVNPLWRQVAATYTKQLLRPDYAHRPQGAPEVRHHGGAGPAGGHQRGLRPHLGGRGEGLDDQGRGPGGGGAGAPAGRPGRGPRPHGAAAAAAEVRPPAPGGRPGSQNGAGAATKALEQKASLPGVNAIPAMQDVLTALSAPLVQADLEAYLREQHQRVVQAVLKEG